MTMMPKFPADIPGPMDGPASETQLRVLVVSHAHPSLSLGGAEIASHNLHKGLNATPGVRSHYLARVGSPVARHGATALMSLRQASGDFLYHADDYDHFLLSNRNTEELERDFMRVVSEVQPDVVHIHHFIGLGLETIHAIRRACPQAIIVFTFHEYLSICHHHGQMVKTNSNRLCDRATPSDCNRCFPEISPARFLRRESFARGMFGAVDHFVSPSHFLIDRYVTWGLPAERFSMIENGLTLEDAVPARTLTPTAPRRSRFAYFGQMTPYKGVDVLIEAVTRVPDTVWGEDSVLMIFGGNLEFQPKAYREKVEALVERAGRRVRFHGSYRNDEMPRLMREIDWVVTPSIWWENSPIVIQEAFFHGRPLICSNIGGMAEKIPDGVAGLHFRTGSAEDLAEKLSQALTDTPLWDRLRAGAPATTSARDCADQHLALYRSLIERRRTEAPAAPETASASA
jgi:glycosyltransferase involved in cell wall biosynthesis